MCEMQKLRLSVEQILTAAAEEIFGVFQRSIAEIEEKLSDSSKHNKRNQRLSETDHQTEQQGRSPNVGQDDPEPPQSKEDQEEEWIRQEGENTMNFWSKPPSRPRAECPTFFQKLWMVKEEPPLEKQDRSHSVYEVDLEPPHIKEEENLWTNEEGAEADIPTFPSTPPHVKSEYDEDEAQSSQFRLSQTEENTQEPEDGDDHGESEPDSIQNNYVPISDVRWRTSQYQRIEDHKTPEFLSVLGTRMKVHSMKKPFTCSVCNKGFAYKGNLRDHMVVHTGEKPFCCSVCKKSFAHKSNLKEHMLVHTGEKPFSCSVCKKCFSHKSNRKKHMLVHTGERAFCCSICDKSFAYKHNLKRHLLTHIERKASIH